MFLFCSAPAVLMVPLWKGQRHGGSGLPFLLHTNVTCHFREVSHNLPGVWWCLSVCPVSILLLNSRLSILRADFLSSMLHSSAGRQGKLSTSCLD